MSDKIVIEVDYKNTTKARTSVDKLAESVKIARKNVNEFSRQKVTTEISANNTRFIAALKKADSAAKDYQKSQFKILDSINNKTNKVIDKISSKVKSFSQGSYNTSIKLNVSSALKNINVLENQLGKLSRENWTVKVTTVTSKLDKPKTKTYPERKKVDSTVTKTSESINVATSSDRSETPEAAKKEPKTKPVTFKDKVMKVKDDFLKDPLGTIQSGVSKVEEKFSQAEDIFNKLGEIKGHYNKAKDFFKPKGSDASSGGSNNSSPEQQTGTSKDRTSKSTGPGKFAEKVDSVKNIYNSGKDFFSEAKKLFSTGKKGDDSGEGKSGGFLDKLENIKNMAGDAKDIFKEAKSLIKPAGKDGKSSPKSWINKLTKKLGSIKDSGPLNKVKGIAGKAVETAKSSNLFQQFGKIKDTFKGGDVLGKVKGYAGKALETAKSSRLVDAGKSLISKAPKVSSVLGEAVGKKALTGGLVSKAGSGALSLGNKALTAGTQLVTKLGAAGTAGAAVTVMGVADGAKDIYKGLKADNDYDKKYETTKGAAKVGGTLTGAAIGTAILPGIGTFLGGAIGYFTGKFGGEKAAEKVAGGSEGAAKYADKSENAAIKVAEQNAPVVEKFDEKLATIQNTDERNEAISGFVDKMSETTEALTTLAQDKLDKGEEVPEEVLSYLNAMSTYQTMLQEGNNPNIFGNQPTGQYVDPNAPQTYNQGPTVPGANAEKGTDGMTAPLQLILSGEKEVKDKVEVSAKDFLTKDNVQATVRVDINVIPQVTTQVTGGGKKGNRPKKEFRGGIVGGNVPGFAEGGYVQGGAQLITVAEEGTPEAIIPLGKHRRKRAMELFGQVGSYLQAPGFSPKGFAAGGIVGGSIGGGFGGGMPTVVEVGGVEIKVEAKDGQNLVETIRENKEAISEEIAGVFNAAFKGQFANTPASGGVSA